MTRGLILVFVFGALLAACQKQQAPVALGVVYNNELTNALQQPEVFKKKRTILEFTSGATGQTCEDYLQLTVSSTVKEEINNQMVKSEYLVCEALALIGDKQLTAADTNVAFGQILATRLDLRSFPSSLFQMLDDQKYTLENLDTKVKVATTSVTYETQEWHYRLELVATLDVNNNGKVDWVLWLADEAKPGNYRQYQTLVVYDVGNTGLLRATPFASLRNNAPT